MTIAKNNSRKTVFVAEAKITHADVNTVGGGEVVSGTAFDAIDMPAGTVVDDAYLVVDELFDHNAAAIELGIDGSVAKFVSSQNVFTGEALGGRAGAATGKGYRFTSPGHIVMEYTGGDKATAGQVRAIVLFHYENDSEFVVEIA